MDQSKGIDLALFVAGILTMLLLAISIIFFFILYQRRLFAQQERLRQLELDNQKELLRTTIQAEESERKRIANDLHDSIGSLLSTTRLMINQLNQSSEPQGYQELKTEATGLIDETIATIRTITRNLSPPSLEQLGLIAAIEELCRRIRDLGGVHITFSYDQNIRIEPHQEVALFRVIQELINNTLKHAEATEIYIRASFSPLELQLSYQDNGKGFDWTDRKEISRSTGGLGLASIEGRVNAINGSLQFKSQKNEGMSLMITTKIN